MIGAMDSNALDSDEEEFADEACPRSAAGEVQKEAKGWTLHLSSKSSSGYKGVQWIERKRTYYVRGPKGPGMHEPHLGQAATAVEAAILYAKHMAGLAEGERVQKRSRVTMRR